MVYLCYVICLDTHSSQDQQMDGLGYVTNSWGYGATLMSRHGIICCAPLFWGRLENDCLVL